ncbi:MAG: cytochrome c maturation protein CcmE [Rhodothermales bacterium]|nr:cytochrome c maturation protein CcmE [Rhodothermales bacterium]
MKIKNFIALGAGVVFVAVLFMNFGSSVGGYMNFQEAQASGSNAHIVGQWASDLPFSYNKDTNVFSFHMRDESGQLLQVHYPNPKPANFEDAEKLVIEGRVEGDVLMAEHILVKCPSKYNDTNVMGT